MKTGDQVTATVEELAAGGDAVARVASDDGAFVVFVDGGAPGDVLRIRLTERKKRFARGRIEAVLEAGPSRVEPTCRHAVADACGGCDWLHVSLPVQNQAKHTIVVRALRRVIDEDSRVEPLLTPCAPTHWRRRARLSFSVGQKGDVLLGLRARRSHKLVDLTDCGQLDPRLMATLAPIRTALAKLPGAVGEVMLVVGHRGEIHLHLALDDHKRRGLRRLLEGLLGKAGIVGASAHRGFVGEATIEIEPGLRGVATDFAQASAAGNAKLVEVVDELAGDRSGNGVLELYCGNGNFTRRLAPATVRYLATDGAISAHRPEIPGVTWREGEIEAVLDQVERDPGPGFQLAVLDPPRTGAPGVLARLDALGVDRIVYVSCDPATLARDLESVAATFAVEVVAPIDLMPQTSHVETVVRLRRR